MNGAEILVKCLEDLQVKRVAGYPGAAILPVFHALAGSGIAVTVNANEQAGAFCAAGMSRAGDQVGVTVVTSGPAITNTLTAVADCNADSIPLLVFAGQVPSGKLGTDEFQHINVSRVFAKAAKKVALISDASHIEEAVKDAWHFAKSGKPGPVVIDLPMDVQTAEGEYHGLDPKLFRHKYDDERHLGENQCRRFFDLLQGAKRPLLYIGGGLNNQKASDRIRRFNDLFAIPSINSLMGKGILDESRDTSLGMLGMFGTPYANTAIQETDLFIGMGVRWDDRVRQRVGEKGLEADIAYIDINPEKVQEVRVTRAPKFTFIGDAGTALDDLLSWAEKNPMKLEIGEWQERVRNLKKETPLNFNRAAAAIQQAEVMEILSGLLPEDVRIATGVGNHQMLAAQHLKIRRPKSFLTSGGFGVMGFALPIAVGACLADPSRTVLAIDGDASLRMNMGELHTIGAGNLPVKILLLNNYSAGMVRNIQTARYANCVIATEEGCRDVSFARIAAECGFAWTRRTEERSGLKADLEALLAAKGPALLEVVTDVEEAVYPVIAPGDGYQGMDLGPFMGGRKQENCSFAFFGAGRRHSVKE